LDDNINNAGETMSNERGRAGMKYEEKSFSVSMGSGPLVLSLEEQREMAALKEEREAEAKRIHEETQRELSRKASQKVTKKLIPYGTRILVKRRKVEDKSSHIILPDEVKNLPTDIADVIEVPEQTFTDQKVIANAGAIVESLTIKACSGDASAVRALLDFKEYLQVMTIKKGDVLLMARYGGTDFLIQETNQMLCVCEASGIYAFIKELKVTQPTQGVEKVG
jgi:co-chaperonin GroES (HSP10)